MRRCSWLPLGLGMFLATVLPVRAAPAWPVGFPHRLSLQVRAAPVQHPLLVVLPGSAVLAALPGRQIPVSGLRAMGRDGRVWPLQVDERDGTSAYIHAPNRWLDANDEIALLASVDQGGQGYLYVSTVGKPLSAPASALILNGAGPPEDLGATLRVDSPFLQAVVRGPETGDPGQKGPPGLGKGSLVKLNGMTSSGSWDSNCLWHHPFLFWGSPEQWSSPRLLSRGPVRLVVETHIDNPSPDLRRVTHLFTFPTAPGNPLQIDEVLEAREPGGLPQTLAQNLRISPGGAADQGDTYVIPDAEGFREMVLGEIAKPQQWVDLPAPPEEGANWFAWQDGSGGSGLAVIPPLRATYSIRAVLPSPPYPYSVGNSIFTAPPETDAAGLVGRIRFSLLPFSGETPVSRVQDIVRLRDGGAVRLGPPEAGPAAPRPQNWLTDRTYRVRMSLPGPAVALPAHPVIISAQELYRASGAVQIRADSLLLACGGQPTPIQVISRIGPLLSEQPHNILGPDDDLCWVLDLPAGKTQSLEIYYNRATVEDTQRSQAAVPAGEGPRLQAQNGDWRVTLYGAAAEGLEGLDLHANGALRELVWRGTSLLSGGSWGSNLFPGFALRGQKVSYSSPRFFAQGKVATVLGTVGASPFGPGSSVGHYVTLFEGSAVLACEEAFVWPAQISSFAPQYTFPISPGGAGNEDDVFATVIAGQAQKFAMADFYRPEVEARQFALYRTLLPETGWLAWWDTQKDHGLAVCFDPTGAHVSVDYHKTIQYAYAASENPVSYTGTHATGRERFRFYAIGTDAAEVPRLPERYRYLMQLSSILSVGGEEAES
ncbi:MAG: hypothetical protein GX100_13570 [candidate division WS1 bacterium]|nr:hypothetical protein [candidate division WS1 bacterium]